MSIFGVDEEGLIICPTEVFAGASSLTATASPSEALRFFLDFFSAVQERIIMCDKTMGMRLILMRLAWCWHGTPSRQETTENPSQNPSYLISIHHYSTTSSRQTHPNLPYFNISKRRKCFFSYTISILYWLGGFNTSELAGVGRVAENERTTGHQQMSFRRTDFMTYFRIFHERLDGSRGDGDGDGDTR